MRLKCHRIAYFPTDDKLYYPRGEMAEKAITERNNESNNNIKK